MIYNMLSCPIIFLPTIHIVVKDLAFSSPLNDPPRRTNGIHEGVANENHCLLEGQVEEKDYEHQYNRGNKPSYTYRSQHGNNEQEIKKEQVFGL